MELFGEKLKSTRESKNYTAEQVARDTKISLKYIHALETDDFQAFPGETYLIGFLKSYTEFLGLDSDKYINLYKNYKIQEQEIPIHELLDDKKRMPPLLIAAIPIACLLVVAGVAAVLFFTVFGRQPGTAGTLVSAQENIKAMKEVYDFKDEVVTRWFKPGDEIRFGMSDLNYTIDIDTEKEDLSLKTESVTKTVKLSEYAYFDFNSDGKADMKVTYNDLRKEDDAPQVNLGLYKITVSTPDYVTEETASDASQEESADVSIRVKEDTRTVILEAEKPSLFTVKIAFRNYCLLRYLIDNRTRDQRFFIKKDNLNFDAKSSVKLWISNANAVNAQVSGKEIIMGKAGQVVTKLLHWVKNTSSGKYELEIVSVY
jgi:cytoskeleton protein RodZ